MRLHHNPLSRALLTTPLLLGLVTRLCAAEEPAPDAGFTKYVKPVLEAACVTCHNADKPKGDISLHTREAALASISENDGACLVPGRPGDSGLYSTTVLPEDDDLIMPPKGDPLDKSQTDRIKEWIASGAPWPEGVVLEKTPRIGFVKHVQPILEQNCVTCHKPGKAEGGWDTTTREAAFTSGDNSPSIVPFDPENSALYFLTALPGDDDALMPPAKSGGPMGADDIGILRMWVAQGAIWPEGVTLTQKAKGETGRPPSPDDLELVRKIHSFIVQTSGGEAAVKAYSETIPKTGVSFEMAPIPGGRFLMGSPEGEAGRRDDEGPQRQIQIAPFWMGKHEVTWDEYTPFMSTPVDRYKDGSLKSVPDGATPADVVSQPTKAYVEMSFGMGIDGYPAISMTQHAANKYCQWISAQTGHFYRLPTEAEWEYACRAGTTTAYHFGDDPSLLGDHAWYDENSDDSYQPVGRKKPNPWGLHDMHGNVREWVLDGYQPAAYASAVTPGTAGVPWLQATTIYPRTVRGGSWDDDAENLRSASRKASRKEWKLRDPVLPKSIWYHTNATWLGFRVVRPEKIPTPEEMSAYWNTGQVGQK